MKKKQLTLVTLVASITCLSASCTGIQLRSAGESLKLAGIQVKTWLLSVADPATPLHHGADRQTLSQGNGYRCYSEEDDVVWRERLELYARCCEGR